MNNLRLASMRVGAALLVSGLLAAPLAMAEQSMPGASEVRALTLSNGMKIIVWPDHDIPNVALYNFVRAGSRNEAPGITGLAHFFEHMMFNGTARRAQGEFDREMEARGGSNNASTSEDLTIYSDWFPRSALDLVFDLESDRLEHLAFVPKVIESERNVVYSERRLRVEDNNQGMLMEQVQATAFVAHPYQIPTIGWPSDIQSWRTEDLQKFFKTYYAPNNCTLVVAGDVTPDEVFALAKKYLEPIPRQEPPQPVHTREPEQSGEKHLLLERKAQTPLLQFAYKTPAASDAAAPAIDLLLLILTEGDSSRLHRALVEQQKVAISADGYWHQGFDPSLLWIFLTLPEGGAPQAAQQALDMELQKMADTGVTAQELTRAKNLTATEFWKSVATINGKARLLGQFEVLHGDYQKLFAAPGAYQAVTAAQVQAAARTILQTRQRTVGVLQAPAGVK